MLRTQLSIRSLDREFCFLDRYFESRLNVQQGRIARWAGGIAPRRYELCALRAPGTVVRGYSADAICQAIAALTPSAQPAAAEAARDG